MIRGITKRCSKEFALSKIKVMQEFWQFIRYHKKFWLAPIVFALVLVGFLLAVTKGSAIAPFIYALF